MIIADSIEIQLSDTMRGRIARQEVNGSEQEMIHDTLRLCKHLCCGNRHRFFETYMPMLLICSGGIDPQAQVSFLTDDAKGERRSDSLLALVIEHYQSHNDVESIAALIEKAGPNVLNARGVPAYAKAFERYVSGLIHSPYPWEECRKHPDLDLEIAYEGGVQQVVHMNHTLQCQLSGTLLNQLCEEWDFIRRHNADDGVEHGIYYLLDMDAILAPEWLSLKEVSGPNRPYVPKWQKQFEALKQAIDQGDAKAVDAAIAQNAHARGFSLGYGSQLCCKEFWGDFWSEGLGAMLSLPGWVQERLAHELTQAVMCEAPYGYITQIISDGKISAHCRAAGQ